jgi:hypothetical protein
VLERGAGCPSYLASALLRRGVERDIEIISKVSPHPRRPAGAASADPVAADCSDRKHSSRWLSRVDSTIIWTIVTVELGASQQAVEGMIAEVERRAGA